MNSVFRSNLVLSLAATAAFLFVGEQPLRAATAGKTPIAKPAMTKTTITVTRSTDSLYYAATPAVDVNGNKVADLRPGESYTGGIAPGATVVTASSWSSPGKSSYSFTAQPGKTYRLVVKPHSGNFLAVMAGGLVGQAIEGHGQFEIAPEQ